MNNNNNEHNSRIIINCIYLLLFYYRYHKYRTRPSYAVYRYISYNTLKQRQQKQMCWQINLFTDTINL